MKEGRQTRDNGGMMKEGRRDVKKDKGGIMEERKRREGEI